MIVSRHDMRERVAHVLAKLGRREEPPEDEPESLPVEVAEEAAGEDPDAAE